MTAKTAWAHLPNAKYIDAVLVGTDASIDVWNKAHAVVADMLAAPDGTYVTAWDAAYVAAQQCGRRKIISEIGSLNSAGVSLSVILPVVGALIAWDSAADLLECTPDVLRAMIDLAEPPVCHQAALLLPYAIVRFGT